jgi:hypothetical protein
VAYLVGNWIFEKLAPKAPKFASLAVGILIYALLRSIPLLGWVIGVLVIAWGVGSAWLTYRSGGLDCFESGGAEETPSAPVEASG